MMTGSFGNRLREERNFGFVDIVGCLITHSNPRGTYYGRPVNFTSGRRNIAHQTVGTGQREQTKAMSGTLIKTS